MNKARLNTPLADRSDLAKKVITFKMGFRPSGFDRPVTDYCRDAIQSKLAMAGVATLTVIFMRGPHGERILHFDGPAEDIAKAKAALNLDRETQIAPLQREPCN